MKSQVVFDVRNKAKNNRPVSAEQIKRIREAYDEHFVQPLIRKHLADELHYLVPALIHQLQQTARGIQILEDQYGLASVFLNSHLGGANRIRKLKALAEVLERHLTDSLIANDQKLFSDLWTGRTKGNRHQVELAQFVWEVAEILKTPRGVPWNAVQLAIKLIAAEDLRLQNTAQGYIKNGEYGERSLRALYNRTVRKLNAIPKHTYFDQTRFPRYNNEV